MSGLAIFIACLGLLGLTAFTCEQRTKEVSIRRVHGAGTGSVLGLLLRESLWAVVLGSLVAWPIAWFAMRQWLQDYPYAIDLQPGIFIAATAAVLVVALLTTCSQTLRAAWSSPVDAFGMSDLEDSRACEARLEPPPRAATSRRRPRPPSCRNGVRRSHRR